jgi:GMP synthase (glutamine-hydrolysing)
MSAALLVLQHAGCEPPGVYEDVLHERGISFDRVVLGDTVELPDWRPYAAIIAMGGAMGAYEDRAHPWLAAEKRLVAEAVGDGKPYWGVCLGAQVLAAALGAEVRPGPAPELGVLDVELTAEARSDPVFAAAPARFASLQWHRDTYELPAGAVRLARSAGYEQQAFALGRAYGLQFHLEVDGALAAEWMEVPEYVAELRELDGAGAPARMLSEVRAAEAQTVPLARELFSRWLDQVVGHAAQRGIQREMATDNVEIVRTYFEAFDSGELDRAAEYLDPDVRWTNTTLIDDRTIAGRAAVRTYWDRILSTFAFVHDDPTFTAAGDRVCVIAHVRAKGAASGIELARPCGYALTLRDGLITESLFFRDPEEARQAAGVAG